MNELTLVSIGAYGRDGLTLGALDALKAAKKLILRTGRHPVADFLKSEGVPFETLDALYEQSEDFDAFCEAAAKAVLSSCEEAPTTYAISSLTQDTTVESLLARAPEGLSIRTVESAEPSGSVLGALMQAGVRGLGDGALRIATATAFQEARVTPGEPLLLTELHSAVCAGDCKLKLLTLMPDEHPIYIIQGDLQPIPIPLYELDRQKTYDHLTCAFIPAAKMLARERRDMDDLIAVMARLRGEGGCPWDREQTHETLLQSLLEESWEFIDAVQAGDVDHMYDELGDVLLQVVFHAQIAKDHGDFDITDVTSAICQKMIERHTHIFGTEKADTAEQVLDNWEAIKRKQRGIKSTAQAMRDISNGLSALLRASKVQHKAAKVGFDFESATDALGKVTEEAGEVAQSLENGAGTPEELGDLLFSVVNVCRLAGVEPDIALHKATEKFIARFSGMEESIKKTGKCFESLTLREMDVYWEAEKHLRTLQGNDPAVLMRGTDKR